MKNYGYSILAASLFVFLLISSCSKTIIGDPIVETDSLKYSFFVAGHTYGNPNSYDYGLHPPFSNAITFINNYPKIEIGILTGDVVQSSTQEFWDSAIVKINKFNIPIHIASGNHDRSALFLTLFDKYYYSFFHERDLFIILTPTNWNIENEQLEFLRQKILDNYNYVENIFIFIHELVWWSPENIFKNIKINYAPYYPGSTNYWDEIHPFLDSLPNNIVIFAGDLGCTQQVSPYMYYKQDNITLIGSGMGGGVEDNIIIVEVDYNDNISYKLIGLNNGFSELMKLENYVLP